MCGIFAVCNCQDDVSELRQRALMLSKRVRHRGPDWSGCKIAGNNILCHERLAIYGVNSGAQPITNEDESIILTVNGEIYNHKPLRKILKGKHSFKTESDCEVIIHLYAELGSSFVNLLDGMFSFVLLDVNKNRFIAARDPIGITTFYQGFLSTSPGTVFFASELKCLHEECDRIISFPPGHIYDSATGLTTQYYQPKWLDASTIPTKPVNYVHLRNLLEEAVRKRLMSEVPYGVLLSGGLDSSLIASIAARQTQQIVKKELKRQETRGRNAAEENGSGSEEEDRLASWPRLHSFSIGLSGSPDLMAAREVAKFIGTIHHEYTFTIQEGLDAVQDVIYHLETYDVTTIRASVPMYLLSRRIKAQGVKMVLSGEGSDEIFGGYLYFHSAPDAKSFHEETVSRVKNLHTADCLRANKATLAWGLEARVPFLDVSFLAEVMTIDPTEKMCVNGRIEKHILRKAFDTPEKPYLPNKILWRQKEQFSDGVGYGWIDWLKSTADAKVSDQQMATAGERWPYDTPATKEAYWYRAMFESWFPQPACTDSVVRWIPRADWGCPPDPSGRAQRAHVAGYDSINGINGLKDDD